MATPESEVLAAAEAAASSPCVAAEALAPASEAAAELDCVCSVAALMLSMRVSTSLTAICREPFNSVDTT